MIVLGVFAVGCQDFYLPMGPVYDYEPDDELWFCLDADNDTLYYDSAECFDECDF